MNALRAELIEAINDPNTDWDRDFDAWATRIFAHQFEHNAPYRNLAEGRGISSVSGWREVPAVPTDAFKYVELSTAPDAVTHTFLTSGTTLDARGKHHFLNLDVYRAAIEGPFRNYCLPKGRMPILVLAAAPGEMPESSLSFMCGELLKTCGDPRYSGFFLAREENGEFEFDYDGVVDALDFLEKSKVPVFILGTAFAYVDFLDTVGDLRWKLAPGSRVLETGGLKGRTREVSRAELYALFGSRLGIAPSHALSEYSMTELSSQAYTDAMVRGVGHEEAVFRTPGWARVEIVDPVSLEVLDTPDARGLIRWYDLANLDSVMAVQTSDIGQRRAGGFVLEGRAPEADLRGCSLVIEEIVG
ncbi:hypothetical protein FRD01_10990 [Microvenator marinus]|uniref:Uncharacterized protein n=1 Tax=Microvenator marinus TaxID=2600177 RepID=A0A5B8XWA8_9DELT|nr:hypothetical protein [Microvenator marinus]QED27749.1 hypothetical protein FRD01_10990 [Microvenator marinus]